MRIAFDHQIFIRQKYGGVSRYIYELAREISTTTTHEVTIVSPLYKNKYLKYAPKQLKIMGIPIMPVPRIEQIVGVANTRLVKPILGWIDPDIVHETYYKAERLAPKSSKVILTVHDMIHERFHDSFPASDKTRSLKKSAIERADHIICISKQTQRDLIELTEIEPEKTTVVHHGYELAKNIVRKSEVTHSKPFILYVGNRVGYKNFDRLLKAISNEKELQGSYDLFCFGGGAFTSREKELFVKLGFKEGNIRLVSGTDEVLADLYRNAKLFVYPSLYEGFGIPPLEAMSFDCPVACSNTSSIPEVVGNAGAYFDPTNIDEISFTLKKLLSDEEYRKKLIISGRERIKLFSWNRCASETLEVYRNVINRSS